MKYISDEDLNFFAELNSDDLDILVEILTKNKDGEERLTENLTLEEEFIQNQPDHAKYWDLIAAELQTFGGNSFANFLRGDKGVPYREILIDVSKKLKVNFNDEASTTIIENNIFMKILSDSMEKMDPKELKEFTDELGIKTTSFTSNAVIAALQIAVKKSGFLAYQIAVIVANSVAKQVIGRGLSLAGNAALTKSLSIFAGPIGWIISTIWTLYDIAGPAYRVTIPAVIQVAYLRKKSDSE